MKKIKLIFLPAIIMVMSVTCVCGETLKSLDFHGRWPSASQRAAAIDENKNLLFLADGNVISVLQTSDLTIVSKMDLLVSTGIKALVINSENTYLYAACGRDGVKIIDVSNPGNLFVAGELSVGLPGDEIFGSGIACLANYVYLADVFYGLRVIDVTDPANPFQVSAFEQVNVNSDGEIFSGGHENLAVEEINHLIYVFVLDKYRGMRVFEITGDRITLVTNYPENTTPTSLYSTKPVTDIVIIEKKHAVISDYENGLVFVDLFSNTETPDSIMISTLVNLATPGSSAGLSASGDSLYVADGHGGMQVVDITDIANPVITGNFATSGAHNVISDSQAAFVSDSHKGLQRIDCAVKTAPAATHFYDTPSDTDAVFVEEGLVYGVDDDESGEGLRIIRYSETDQYEMTGFCITPGTASAVYVFKSFAYVADGSSGMTVIDVGDPASPEFKTSVNAENAMENAVDVYVAAGFAYLADENNGIFVFDVSDPGNPTFAGSYNPGKDFHSIRVMDGDAYAAHGTGVDVIEISDPADLYVKGTLISDGGTLDFFVDEKYGYAANGLNGFSLVNIQKPENPFVENTYKTAGVCEAVGVYNVFVHCAVGEAGVEVVGVTNSDPPKLTFAASVDTPGYAADIFVAGNDTDRFTYVADSSGGLIVFKHNDRYAGGIDAKPFTESTHDRGWDNVCFISSLL